MPAVWKIYSLSLSLSPQHIAASKQYPSGGVQHVLVSLSQTMSSYGVSVQQSLVWLQEVPTARQQVLVEGQHTLQAASP